MALFDMIKETLDEGREYDKDDIFAPGNENFLSGEDFIFPTYETRSYDAQNFLDAMEGTTEIKRGAFDNYMHDLHIALEANLPNEAPAYDPSYELENIERTLAGVDADNVDGEPDQHHTDTDPDDIDSIGDLMSIDLYEDEEDPDDLGILSV